VSFLIDTDTCSAYLKQNPRAFGRFQQYLGSLNVSMITVGELYTWALRAKAPPKRLQGVLDLFLDVTIIDFSHDVARKFGELHAGLLDIGRPPGFPDLMIAATALVHNLTLVTHNTQDFANIPGLTVVDWLIP
jgi:tRNA(fMet)-specific endonuclease VapC